MEIMQYQMRPLKTNDIFPMSKIIKKMNLKLDKVSFKDKTQEQAGVEILLMAAENLHLAQEEVNSFLGSLVGITGQDFGELPIEDSLSIIQQFREQKGLSSFFNLAAKSTR
jgi:hypothetical protein